MLTRDLFAIPPLDRLLSLLTTASHPVYLVGGALRDHLLERQTPLHDLDFAVAGDAVTLGRRVADELGGGFFLLDADRGTARVLLQDMTLDFAQLRGSSLVEDLADRDFTVNAIALPLKGAAEKARRLIDPTGGRQDLDARLLRPTGPEAMRSDPVRALRAFRLAAELGFQLAPEAEPIIRAAAPLLPQISAERIRDEFLRLLVAPQAANSIRELDRAGLLAHIIPEMEATRGQTQPPPHQLDVFDHLLLVVDALARIVSTLASADQASDPSSRALQEQLHAYAPFLRQHLGRRTAGDRTGLMILLLGGLLHDTGKPHTQSLGGDGEIRFYGHEAVGATLAAARGRGLALSGRETTHLSQLVLNHMRPGALSREPKPPSRRAVYRYFRDAELAGVDACLLCLADGLARGGPVDSEDWQRRLSTVALLLDHYIHRYDQVIAPRPLIGGRELMEATGLAPGPEIGRLLRLIEESQAAGEVASAGEALRLAREALAQP